MVKHGTGSGSRQKRVVPQPPGLPVAGEAGGATTSGAPGEMDGRPVRVYADGALLAASRGGAAHTVRRAAPRHATALACAHDVDSVRMRRHRRRRHAQASSTCSTLATPAPWSKPRSCASLQRARIRRPAAPGSAQPSSIPPPPPPAPRPG